MDTWPTSPPPSASGTRQPEAVTPLANCTAIDRDGNEEVVVASGASAPEGGDGSVVAFLGAAFCSARP